MSAELPECWQNGLSALLAAETEQAALEAAVCTIADLLKPCPVFRITFRDDNQVLGAICTLNCAENLVANSAYFAIFELAFVQTVQRLRRLTETRLLYEISLRLSNTLDLPQLLQDVLALTATTFAATSSRI